MQNFFGGEYRMKAQKLFCLLLSLILLLLVGCSKPASTGGESGDLSSDEASKTSSSAPVIEYFVNNLTGEKNLTADERGLKPLAVAINNISVAQKVQSGIGFADVVFETEVEGGITRLLALYKAPKEEYGPIGAIRSARVVFAELAKSMNAAYVFHGRDEKYCTPRIKALGLPCIEISEKAYGERKSNGLSWEHRLYTSGKGLKNAIRDKGYSNNSDEPAWLKFTDEKQMPTEKIAQKVQAKFNSTYITEFYYNSDSGKYCRGAKGVIFTDYTSGKNEEFKNVFVLKTEMHYFSDNYHRDIKLNGGSGYYATGGRYEEIRWSKSGEDTPIKFFDAYGNELSVAVGNSYVCIVSQVSGGFIAE